MDFVDDAIAGRLPITGKPGCRVCAVEGAKRRRCARPRAFLSGPAVKTDDTEPKRSAHALISLACEPEVQNSADRLRRERLAVLLRDDGKSQPQGVEQRGKCP